MANHPNQNGNALALSLLILLVATLFTSSLLMSSGNGSILAHRHSARTQASYLAEAAIRLKAWQLVAPVQDTNALGFLSADAPLAVPAVQIDSSDFWIHLSADAMYQNQSARVIVQLGKPRQRDVFRYAIRILDAMEPSAQSQLHVQGDVLYASDNSPIASSQIIQQASAIPERHWQDHSNQLRDLLAPDSAGSCAEGCRHGNQKIWKAEDLSSAFPLRVLNGDLSIDLGTSSTPTRVPGKVTLAAQGDLEIRGDIAADTLVVLAEGSIHFKGQIRVQSLTVFAKGRIDIEGALQAEVRLFAQGDIRIGGDSQLLPWSFVITAHNTSTPELGRGDILFLDHARFSGYAICATNGAAVAQSPMVGAPGIYVASRARVSGAIISIGSVQNEGFIGGVVATRRLACAEKEAENCGGRGEFVRDSLPEGFLQIPEMSFGEPTRLAVVHWSSF